MCAKTLSQCYKLSQEGFSIKHELKCLYIFRNTSGSFVLRQTTEQIMKS